MILVAILKDRFVHAVAKLVVLLVHGEIAATHVMPLSAHDFSKELVLDDRCSEGFNYLPLQSSPQDGRGICGEFDFFANDAFRYVLPDLAAAPAAHHALWVCVFEVHFDEAVVEDHVAVDKDEILAGGQLGSAVEDDGSVEAAVFVPDAPDL